MYKMENNIFWKKLKYLYIVQGMSINNFSQKMIYLLFIITIAQMILMS